MRSALVSLEWRFRHKDAGVAFENQINLWVPESKLGSFQTTSSIGTAATLLDFVGAYKQLYYIEDCS